MPLLPLLTAIRIVINTVYRMAYPFLGVIARGLGGEGLVALTTDRIGKPRAVALGLVGNLFAGLLCRSSGGPRLAR